MTHIHRGEVSPLPAPLIPSAAKGGLNHHDLFGPDGIGIFVEVGPWPYFIDGDIIDILWGLGAELVASVVYDRACHGDTVIVEVSPGRIIRCGEGRHAVTARCSLDADNDYATSEAVFIETKWSLPGGVDPDPSTPHYNEGLAPMTQELISGDDTTAVSLTIAPYENMAEGDEITLFIGALIRKLASLEAQSVGSPVATIVSAGELDHSTGASAFYHIYDRVKNGSGISPAITIEARPTQPNVPVAPWVQGTVNGEGNVLDIGQAPDTDVEVLVEQHGAMAGATVVVRWMGVTLQGRPIRYGSPGMIVQRPTQTLSFHVPWQIVAPLAGADASVSYDVSAPDGQTLQSQARALKIEGAHPGLQAPQVAEASGGTLDPDAARAGCTIVLPPWSGMIEGDRCTLEWIGTTAAGTHSRYSDQDELLEALAPRFKVPAPLVEQIVGGRLRVRYTVSRRDLSNATHREQAWFHETSPWLVLDVLRSETPLSIDDSPLVLDGVMVRVEAAVTHPPAGTWAQREAKGGKPPYRYHADTRAVQLDERSGRIISFAEGKATITVTDARGDTAAYAVEVRNAWHVFGLGMFDWRYKVRAAAGRLQGSIPTRPQWEIIRAAYGGRPPLDDQWAWTDDPAGPGQHYVVRPVTGAVEVRTSSGLFKGSAAGWGIRRIPV